MRHCAKHLQVLTCLQPRYGININIISILEISKLRIRWGTCSKSLYQWVIEHRLTPRTLNTGSVVFTVYLILSPHTWLSWTGDGFYDWRDYQPPGQGPPVSSSNPLFPPLLLFNCRISSPFPGRCHSPSGLAFLLPMPTWGFATSRFTKSNRPTCGFFPPSLCSFCSWSLKYRLHPSLITVLDILPCPGQEQLSPILTTLTPMLQEHFSRIFT